ncbi:hypothetical protein K7432_005966 [Basidiobolus ranarum]|uniref:Gfd2/YDR514C-like C-terminal domain-containing protein n=1 Tax=Basidiobolus ranarum TaxID=34480 RepID=A0ABR2WVL8_9FUNG
MATETISVATEEVPILYRIESLEKTWTRALKQNTNLKDIVARQLKVPDFYLSRSSNTFYLGTSRKDSLRHLLFSKEIYLEVKKSIESLIEENLPSVRLTETCREVEKVEIDSRPTYYRLLKGLSKHNKNTKRLEQERHTLLSLGKAQKAIDQKKYMFFAIDVESYEANHSLITEVGWTMYNSVKNTFLDKHYIVRENLHLRNGKYVADNKEQFTFGKSTYTSLLNTAAMLEADWDSGYPTILVGHDIKNDLEYLRKMGAQMSEPSETFDTSNLYMALTKNKQRRKLSRILDEFGIEHGFLHNAGNDAHYTMEAFLAMIRSTRPCGESSKAHSL